MESRAAVFRPAASRGSWETPTFSECSLVLLIIAVWRLWASRQWRSVSILDFALAIVIIAKTMSATVTVALGVLAVIIGLTAMARRKGLWWRVGLIGAVGAMIGAVVVAVSQWARFVALLGKSPTSLTGSTSGRRS